MKKICVFIFMVSILLFGCDPAGYYFRKDEYIDTILIYEKELLQQKKKS